MRELEPAREVGELGHRGEHRCAVEGGVDLHDAAARLPVADVVDEVGGELRGDRAARRNVIFGWIAVTTSGARELLPVLEDDAGDAAVAREHTRRPGPRCGSRRRTTGRSTRSRRSRRPCRPRERPTRPGGRRRRRRSSGAPSRSRCRARTDRPTCRSARSAPSRSSPDRSRRTDRGCRRCDIVISRVTSPDRPHVEPAEPPREPELLVEVGRALRPDRGRDRHQHRAEHVGEAADPRVPPLDRVGVVLRELRERLVVLRGVVVVLDDAPPVGERQEVRARPGRPCSRGARARGRAGSCRASGSSRS